MNVPTTENKLDENRVRQVLDSCLPLRDGSERDTTLGAGGYDIEAARRYLKTTVEHGFGVPSWPTKLGGRGSDPSEVARISAINAEYVLPDLYPFRVGMKMAGPTLMEHGTEEQQTRWVRAMASGDNIWCQMFSEPDAGSDLANVTTTAELDGDQWTLNGQKVWTSRAEYSDLGLCLARTAPDLPKHQGMTMFVISMSSPGVDIRPLVQMNGDSHFSEVFLSDAQVPDVNRIGAVNGGWRVAVSLLAHERAGADRSAPKSGPQAWPTWLADLAQSESTNNPVVRDRAMQLYILDEVIRLTQLRAAANLQAGRKPGPEGSGMKLQGGRSFKARVDLAANAAGAQALLSDWAGNVDLLTAPSMSIRGGTDEIQRNILGERVLGLPSEPRGDRDLPWSTSRRGQIN